MNKSDLSYLTNLLSTYGFEQTWINLLATLIKCNKQFEYMLKDSFFDNMTILERNILKGLSIAEIGCLYEYSRVYQSASKRKMDGVFFTPDDVADFMSSFSKKFPRGIWLDPCSGIGNLSWYLINSQDNKEKFLKENIILLDMDKLALLIARVLFTISFQETDQNLFFNIQDKFIYFDFLSVWEHGDGTLFRDKNSLEAIPKHDFVIVNPPYLSVSRNKCFETSECSDIYAYFMENIIKTSKGFISVTPQSFTNAAKFHSLRKLLLQKYKDITIFNFDNVPGNIFYGTKFGSLNSNRVNSIRAAITIAGIPNSGQQITPLLRWKSNERKTMFNSLKFFLTPITFDERIFPKVNKDLAPLYRIVKNNKVLKSWCTCDRTEYRLYIPSSPRYFISALKNNVQRASVKVLYFVSREKMEKAYLLLNSSFLYWWWRVCDGGMTLSQSTLDTLPILDFDINLSLIKELERSELENKVYKKNAGKIQENVKHPKSLIYKITEFILPNYSNDLILIHNNSDLYLIKDKND